MTLTEVIQRKRRVKRLISVAELAIAELNREYEELDKAIPEKPKLRRNLKQERIDKYTNMINR